VTSPARTVGRSGIRLLARETEGDATRDIQRATRQLVGGVCVVTHGMGEARKGATASSVSSLGSDPPTLVICVKQCSSLLPALSRGEAFGVSALAANQCEFAEKFAGLAGANDGDGFVEGSWRALSNGVLVLRGAAAIFACEVEEIFERHGHGVVIGRVRRAAAGSESGALLHWRGAYDRIGWSDDEVARAVGLTPIRVSR
jgi:flavin reductase (DIM6/NTAB) family NADH-FMN oxidoreductase RutF